MGVCGGRGGLTVSVATVLDAPIDRIWAEIGTSRLLRYVCAPWQRFVPLDPPALLEVWSAGRYRVLPRAFGFLPIGWQDIVISFPRTDDPSHRQSRDNGCGALVRKWDHMITVQARADGRTDYRDDIDIEAGLLTPLVRAYPRLFYRHRQRRWRGLVRSGFDYGAR